MHEGTIFGGNWNTYAYISQEEGDYVVPVTNNVPLSEVIKMIEQNVASKPLQYSSLICEDSSRVED